MRLSDFGPSKPGRLVRPSPDYWAFVPAPLAPSLTLGADLVSRLSRADRAVGRLAGVVQTIRPGHRLAELFGRREAVRSCRLEGIACDVAELFLAEVVPERPRRPGTEAALAYVRTYEAARGLGRRVDADRRFLRGLHRRISGGGARAGPAPGEFRDRQSWIGPPGCSRLEAVFVPPPVPDMHDALAALERYSRDPDDFPPLIRAALIHYQVEVIQPFLVGTGQVNRLLLALLLVDQPAAATIPVGMSAYLGAGTEEYRRLLNGVTLRGEWEPWLRFFLDGVATQAEETATRVAALLALHDAYRLRLQRAHERQPLYGIVDRLFGHPAVSTTDLARGFALSPTEMRRHLDRLVQLEILAPADAGDGEPAAYVARDILRALDGERPEIASVKEAMRPAVRRRAMHPVIARPSLMAAGGATSEVPDGVSFPVPLIDEAGRRRVLAALVEIEATAREHRRVPDGLAPARRVAVAAGA